jgi:hypothetical protein
VRRAARDVPRVVRAGTHGVAVDVEVDLAGQHQERLVVARLDV